MSRDRIGADRAHRLPRSRLAALLDQGGRKDIVDLAVGTPAFPETSPELIETACAALRQGANQYEDPAGNMQLRERIAAALPGSPDPVSELTVTVGGSEGLCVALLTMVNPGDEVVVIEPFYENFLGGIELAGARPRFVRLSEPDWRLCPSELAAAFNARTKAVILNSPSNPTGRLLSRSDLELIAKLCETWDAYVISDEVYARYTYEGRHWSACDVPELADRSVVVGSLSKSHALSGWRLGYLRASPAWTELLRMVHVATTVGAPTPLQRAAAATDLFGPDTCNHLEGMRKRRDLTVEFLSHAGFRCAPPDGGCYVMAGIHDLWDGDSLSFTQALAERAGVLVAPATAFFAGNGGDRHVRVAFNRPLTTLKLACDRLQDHPWAGPQTR